MGHKKKNPHLTVGTTWKGEDDFKGKNQSSRKG